MKKAILYTRVEKQGVSNPDEFLREQERELREYCKNSNIEVGSVIYDYASGDSFNRYGFTSLYLAIRRGELKADYLLFTTIDVFSTRVSEVIRMHHQLVKLGVTPKGIKPVHVTFIGIIAKND